MIVPFNNLAADNAPFRAAVLKEWKLLLENGQFVGGTPVAELEQLLGERIYAHAVACGSGTDALVLALRAAGVQPGDEVIVPAFSFISTAEAVVLVGATPRFADLQLNGWGIDLDSFRSLLSPRTKAVIPAGLFGDPTPVAELIRAVKNDNISLTVIEDAAQSLGATVDGDHSGALSPFAATSFYPTKPLGCYGEGGMVFAQNRSDAERLRRLRNHGIDNSGLSAETGTNSRLDALQALVLLQKLPQFDRHLLERERLANRYSALLQPLAEEKKLLLPPLSPRAKSTWGQYTIRIPAAKQKGKQRDDLRRALLERGIETAVYYPEPLYRHPALARFAPKQSCPAAEQRSGEVLSLPLFITMTSEQQEWVAESLNRLL